jgi:hypothetical protein
LDIIKELVAKYIVLIVLRALAGVSGGASAGADNYQTSSEGFSQRTLSRQSGLEHGPVPGSPQTAVPATLHGGELVLNKDQQAIMAWGLRKGGADEDDEWACPMGH